MARTAKIPKAMKPFPRCILRSILPLPFTIWRPLMKLEVASIIPKLASTVVKFVNALRSSSIAPILLLVERLQKVLLQQIRDYPQVDQRYWKYQEKVGDRRVVGQLVAGRLAYHHAVGVPERLVAG